MPSAITRTSNAATARRCDRGGTWRSSRPTGPATSRRRASRPAATVPAAARPAATSWSSSMPIGEPSPGPVIPTSGPATSNPTGTPASSGSRLSPATVAARVGQRTPRRTTAPTSSRRPHIPWPTARWMTNQHKTITGTAAIGSSARLFCPWASMRSSRLGNGGQQPGAEGVLLGKPLFGRVGAACAARESVPASAAGGIIASSQTSRARARACPSWSGW